MDSINGISYYLNKCQMLSDTSQMTIFSFRKIAHMCIVCVTQSNCEWNMWFSCFSVLPGSAEAQVIWGGIVKCLLIAYFISNISAKKYQNPFMCVKVIASQRWDVFSRHGCIFTDYTDAGYNSNPSGDAWQFRVMMMASVGNFDLIK